MKPIIKIHRWWQDENQTSSSCVVLSEDNHPLFASLSLERGWRDNKPNVSCYPKGIYDVKLEWSPRFKQMLWEVKGVTGRSECKFHASNYWYQLNGCNALGLRFKDINNDGYRDVTYSKRTMQQFHQSLKGYTEALLIVTGELGVN